MNDKLVCMFAVILFQIVQDIDKMNKQTARVTKHHFNAKIGQQLDYWGRITRDVGVFNLLNTLKKLHSTPLCITSV